VRLDAWLPSLKRETTACPDLGKAVAGPLIPSGVDGLGRFVGVFVQQSLKRIRSGDMARHATPNSRDPS
jgi:hypothetical protein